MREITPLFLLKIIRKNAKIEKYMESLEKNKNQIKEKSEAWQKNYLEKVDKIIMSEKADCGALFNVLWESGILDRIAPRDQEIKQARMILNKAVWEGSRDDPELYWRILYSAAAAKQAAEKRWTIVAGTGGYITGSFEGMNRVIYSAKGNNFFPEVYNFDEKERQDPTVILTEEIMARARQELEKRSVKPPEKLLPSGGKGKFNGIEVTIGRYTDDGLVWLEADNIKDHTELYKFTKGRGVSPSQLNPEDFKV